MAGINYARMRQYVAQMISADPATVDFYTRGADAWSATGRLAPAGSRTFGRVGQSKQIPGTELVGRQLHVLELPYDTRLPNVNDEARTIRQGVEQRFTVVTVLPTPWKLEVVFDESG